MSSDDLKLKAFNILVVAGLCVAAYFILVSARESVPPPDDRWFQQAVIARSEPVLVKFGADWCGPCQMMETELDQFARSVKGRVAVVRVDVDQHRNLAQHYGVSSIPRLLLFRDGQVVADRVGFADHRKLQEWIASYSRN